MNWIDRKIDNWIKRIRDDPTIKKIPIGGDTNPTYWRWFVFPRNPLFNVYLHNFLKDDEEDLHDHRMMNVSIVLQGGYREEYYIEKPREGEPLPPTNYRKVRRLIPRIRFPSTPHRVILYRNDQGRAMSCWSLFVGGPHWRDWGFWCPGNGRTRWVPWQEYIGEVSPTDPRYGTVGKGCGE